MPGDGPAWEGLVIEIGDRSPQPPG